MMHVRLSRRSVPCYFQHTRVLPHLLVCVFLIGLLTVATYTAVAAQAEVDLVVTVTAGRLNVRSVAGTEGTVVAKLLFGDQVHVNAESVDGDWYQVILADGTQGWISATFAEPVQGTIQISGGLVPFDAINTTMDDVDAPPRILVETTTLADAAVAPEAATENAGETVAEESAAAATDAAVDVAEVTEAAVAQTVAEVTVPTAYTTPANMNIRRGPGTNYPVATSVPAGTALRIMALNPAGDWYQVQLDGEAEPVWVYASLTTAAGPLETLQALREDELPTPPEPAPAAVAVASTAGSAPAPAGPPAGAGFFGYGIQVNAWQGDKAGSAGMVRDIGFTWAKQQVRWEFVENEPGAVNWSEMDQIIDVLHGSGINVLFSVVTAPQWTRPDKPGTGGPPNDFNLYANFVGAMAGRYCGRLQAIEVWNEQNLQREWEGFPLDPGLYMDLLRRSHSSIKAACPSIIVVSGATTPTGNSPVAVDDIDYLRGMYNNG
ncbi:MAG: SH3 domain-containing protein, partial [Caldilineaceae bacterium]|nr:SH3 domain-containing protein [Caldilineaceae bacterium]